MMMQVLLSRRISQELQEFRIGFYDPNQIRKPTHDLLRRFIFVAFVLTPRIVGCAMSAVLGRVIIIIVIVLDVLA